MARMDIEDELFDDPRYKKLERLLGAQTALGAWYETAKLAQNHWKRGRSLIPKHLFNAIDNSEKIIESGIVEVREHGVYLFGTSEKFEWLAKRREAGSAGGVASAEARERDINNLGASKTEQTQPNPSTSNPLTLTLSDGSKEPSSTSSAETPPAPAKPKRKKREVFKPQTIEELFGAIPFEQTTAWGEMYPDDEFRKRTALRAWAYYQRNSRKLPTTLNGWISALDHWFNTDWPKHVRTIPGEKPSATSPAPAADRWLALADTLLAAIRKHPPGDETIANTVGPDWSWISRSGLMSQIRAMKADDFARKRIANDLKTAHERIQPEAAGRSA